ncbi:hypothetical protein BGZ76_001322 [Entomortierella beljakovae]|nr:hypothetical protein BGZ76_001322 [Entomortierella beljakovae]
MYAQYANLISQNPKLRTINITSYLEDGDKSLHIIMDKLLSSYSLRNLSLAISNIDSLFLACILNLSTRLESLQIQSIGFSGYGATGLKTAIVPSVKKLSLSLEHGISTPMQIAIMQKFPHLESLTWYFSGENFPSKQFFNVLSKLSIKTLVLQNMAKCEEDLIKDKTFAAIIRNCKNLTSLNTDEVTFGTASLKSLLEHSDKLEVLAINGGAKSEAIQEILSSCPKLTQLVMPALEARHVLGLPTKAKAKATIPSPVCLNITSFSVHICDFKGKPEGWHQLVFSQLSELKKLEYLDIGPHGTSGRGGLDLRLSAGLGELATLKRLETLQFFVLRQEMAREDVEWMIQAWPRLKTVNGKPHFQNDKAEELNALFKSHKIKIANFDEDEDEEDDEE